MLNRGVQIPSFDQKSVGDIEVIRYWLKLELNKRECSFEGIDEAERPKLIAKLLEYTSGEAAILWKERDVKWIDKKLTVRDIESIRSVKSPSGVGWSRMSDGHSIIDCAQKICAGRVDDETTRFVDVGYIKQIAADICERDLKKIIVKTDESPSAPRVVDGNHHAVASAMYYLKTGEMPDVRAYIGIKQVSALKMLLEKIVYKAGQI